MALLLSALGSMDRWAGVKTTTLQVDGKPMAMAIIEDASFGQDGEGNTTLSIAAGEEPL
jgi:hypothetical protein